jgi:DNA-binding transcriptional regulator YdaS (Cro superfamily)
MVDTEARRQLKRELVGERTQTWLAARLGVGQPAVSGWVLGERRPEPPYRTAIELVLPNVHEEDWLTAEEQARLAEIAREHRDGRLRYWISEGEKAIIDRMRAAA